MNEIAEPLQKAIGERLHISGLIVGFITGLPQLIFPIFAAIFGTKGADNPVLAPGIILAVLTISLLYRWLSWTRFQYYIGPDDIRIESGLISRSARSIPYERIQDVSIEQKPLARLLGLGEVKFETGGGEKEEAKLSYVRFAEAERLRELVRERKSGMTLPIAQNEAGVTTQPPIFAMNTARVLTLGFYSFSLVIFAVLGGIAQQLDFLLPYDFWDISHWLGMAERGVSIDGISLGVRVIGGIGVLIALLATGIGTGMIRTILREHGFRLDRTDKGFRRRRGLLTLTDVVMPVHRVQAAIIQTGPIRKLRGWHALKFVSLAKDSDKKNEDKDHVAAPLATLNEIWPIAEAAMIHAPGAELHFTRGRLAWWIDSWLIVLGLAIVAALIATQLTPAGKLGWLAMIFPSILAVIYFFDWRNNYSAIDTRQIYAKSGWWNQQLAIAPQIKIQSVEISQGPLSRLRGLAKIRFGIAGGALEITALSLATAQAMSQDVMAQIAGLDYSQINRSA